MRGTEILATYRCWALRLRVLLASVDRDLLDMQTIQAIPIIRPGEYWRRTDEID
jgi:hypothetical protein